MDQEHDGVKLRNNVIGLREIVRSGSHRANNFKVGRARLQEVLPAVRPRCMRVQRSRRGRRPTRSFPHRTPCSVAVEASRRPAVAAHPHPARPAHWCQSHQSQGSIYMMFDYMDHDMTGLLERSQRENRRFNTQQARPPAG